MKKLIALFAVAALVLPLAIACNPEDKPAKEVVMQPGPTAESAMVVSFEASPQKPHFENKGQNLEVVGIEFTESGRYFLVCQPLLAESATKTGISGNSRTLVLIAKFDEIAAGKNYKLRAPFDATIEIRDKAVKITRNNDSAEYPAVISKPTTSGVPATNIARAWKVDGCYLKVSGKVNVERGFNGCDFKEIAQFLKENNVKIDPSELDGYKIDEFDFTGSNTMVISFTNTYTFYGDYKLNGENISYLFTVIHNKEILNASASGTLTFPADKKAELMLNTIIDGYSGQITFNLSEAN